MLAAIGKNVSGTAHHLIAMLLAGAAAAAFAVLPAQFGFCTAEMRKDVAAGEAHLIAGRLNAAEDVANDALAEDWRCRCAFMLKAEVQLALMLQAQATGDVGAVRGARAACYRAALGAQRHGDHSPRNKALLKACKAQVA